MIEPKIGNCVCGAEFPLSRNGYYAYKNHVIDSKPLTECIVYYPLRWATELDNLIREKALAAYADKFGNDKAFSVWKVKALLDGSSGVAEEDDE